MFKNYFKIAFRNLLSNKVYSAINILGLATGMAVALLIGLWIWDEVTFNTNHPSYDRLAQVMIVQTMNGETSVEDVVSIPMADELHARFPEFKKVALATSDEDHILAYGEIKISQTGMWAEAGFPSMFTLNMLKGDREALHDPSSMLLSQSLAKKLFGDADPLNKIIRVDNKTDMKIAGVYEDLPGNSTFKEIKFLLPWKTYEATQDWVKQAKTEWANHSFLLFAQLNDHVDPDKADASIRNVPTPHIKDFKEELLLHPMSNWHLYSEFRNGKIAGGRIRFVWLFGIIGIFVLLLACINFMNLSTARSEKRAKEVGIRKAIGSMRNQLIWQFLSESLLVAFVAFVFSMLLLQLAIPFFNTLAGKTMAVPWSSPLFWLCTAGFTLLTGIISGSYPAFYLSGFEPLKVLKGTFKAGRFAAVPRKVMVVTQFTVSVALIIGTIIVFNQIQYAKSRPVGYSREGLITIEMNTPDLYGHYNAIRKDLLQTGVVEDMAQSSSAATRINNNNDGFEWKGKDPGVVMMFRTTGVSHDFGKTLGWQIKAGRDFSRNYSTDTGSAIINETTAKLMRLSNPVGEIIKWDGHPHTVVGVVRDMVTQSPYEPLEPTIYFLQYNWASYMTVRISSQAPLREALAKVSLVFKKYNPGSPFAYKFVDKEYARKFSDEEKIGNLASVFAVLAIFISCLGLFGLASFVAEQRTKEIGIRKVLGASVFHLWGLLSKEFFILVVIACVVAVPLAWYFLDQWLDNYTYRTSISWWIFAASSAGALFIAITTVSFQAIKAAIMNPVHSLKAE